MTEHPALQRPAKLGTTTPHVTVDRDPTLVYFGVPDDTDDGLDGEAERWLEHGPERERWAIPHINDAMCPHDGWPDDERDGAA